MQKTYVLEDLIYCVIELEEICMDLYGQLSAMIEIPDYKDSFKSMATSESQNKRFFNDFVRGFDYLYVLEKEYIGYLRVLLRNNSYMFAFRNPHLDLAMALKTVIHMEKDLLILLYEIKKIFGSSCPEVFDKLLRKRREHLKFLFTVSEEILEAK